MELKIVRQTKTGLEKTEAGFVAGDTLEEILKDFGIAVTDDEGVSCWGERVDLSYEPKDGDRIEIALPLRLSPMEARRKIAEVRRQEAADQRQRRRRHAAG
jgi:putative ubiquitin-RnfH superfamily antitoxin RatB of RatAB toxin-antitoxin module